MEQAYRFFTDTVRLGKKGQITLPKKIRDESHLSENDLFIVTHMPSGDIILRKKNIRTPEDAMLALLQKVPSFDAKQAWKEIREERRRERA